MNTHPTLYSKDSDTQSLHDLPSSGSSTTGKVAGAHNGSVTTIKALDLHGHARQESIDSQLSAYSTYSDRILNRPLYADSTNTKSKNNHKHIITNALNDNAAFHAHHHARLTSLDSPVFFDDTATFNDRKRGSVQLRGLEFDEYTAYGSSPYSDYRDLVSIPTNATGPSPRSVGSRKQPVEEIFRFTDCDSPPRLASSMAYGNEVFDSSSDVMDDSIDNTNRASPLLPVSIFKNRDVENESAPRTSTPPSSDHNQKPSEPQADQKNDLDSIIVHPARAGIPHVFRLRNLDSKIQSQKHETFNARSVYIPVYISGGTVRDGANTVLFPWRNAQDHATLVPTVLRDQTLNNVSAYETAAPAAASSTTMPSPETFKAQKFEVSMGGANDFQTPKFSLSNKPISHSTRSSSSSVKINDRKLTSGNFPTVAPGSTPTCFQPVAFVKKSIDRLSTTLIPNGNNIAGATNTHLSTQEKSTLMTSPPTVLRAQINLPSNTYVTSPLANNSTSQLSNNVSGSPPLAKSNIHELISSPQHCAHNDYNLPQTPAPAHMTQKRNNSADEIKTFANRVQHAQQALDNTDNELMAAAEVAQALLDQKTTGRVWATPALPLQSNLLTTTDSIVHKLPPNGLSAGTSQHIRVSSAFSTSAYFPEKDHSLPQSVYGSRTTEHFLLLIFAFFPPLWLLLGVGKFDGFIVARQGPHTVVRSDGRVEVVAGASRRTKTFAFVFAGAFFLAAITGLVVGLAVGLK